MLHDGANARLLRINLQEMGEARQKKLIKNNKNRKPRHDPQQNAADSVCNGLTAEETVDYLKEKHKISVALQTVYNHRKSLTAQDMVDELLRQQNRDIALADRALKLKYRDRVLAVYAAKAGRGLHRQPNKHKHRRNS